MTALTYRPAADADLDACGRIWRAALNDYLPRVGEPEMPADLTGLRRLHAHLLATDPERFWVAERAGSVVAFTAAAERGDVWFLSMLFVEPAEQGAGIGRALLSRTLPPADAGGVLAVGSDSAQPISNGLYASLGMLPRMPIWLVVGRPRPGWVPQPLPPGVRVEPMTGGRGEDVSPELQHGLDGLDREVAGMIRSKDHAYLRREGRLGFIYRDGRGELLGYGYAAPSGRISPIAVRDAALLAPVTGHLLTALEPPGASAVWVPGGSDGAMSTLLDAGLRLEGFPVLFGWTRPFADFSRFLPISPGLL
jgi:GNAT superfamily N-acetyltransferase